MMCELVSFSSRADEWGGVVTREMADSLSYDLRIGRCKFHDPATGAACV
jgi:hypothetical protein